ncbi:MAG: hypothetical protein AAB368_16705, partial [bacterium]
RDKATNLETPAAAKTFTYDVTGPVSSGTAPADGGDLNDLPTISGTASDTVGLTVAELQVSSGPLYTTRWNGATWVSTDAWVTAAGTATLTWPRPNPTFWQDFGTYRVAARARDFAGNLSLGVTSTFDFDVSPGTATVSPPPAHLAYRNALATISGTAADAFVGLSQVEVNVKRNSDGYFWGGGTGWGAGVAWVTRDGGTPAAWSLTMPATAWTDAASYAIRARAKDLAENVQAAWVVGSSSVSFTFDNVPPASSVTTPGSVTWVSALPTISGTAADSVGISTVQVLIKRAAGYWDGTNFNLGEKWRDAAGATAWSYPAGADTIPPWTNGLDYELRSKATDYAGNPSVVYSTRTFRFDNEVPASSATAPALENAYAGLSTISGTSNDAYSGVNQVELSARNLHTGKYWDGFSGFQSGVETFFVAPTTNPWTYADISGAFYTSGHKYLVRTGARDNSAPANIQTGLLPSVTFTWDTSAPLSAVTTPQNGLFYKPLSVLGGTAADKPDIISSTGTNNAG